MSEQLVISNHGPTISGEPRLCRLCGETWPCTEALVAIREGVKAVKEGRIMPADTFFEWMRAKDVRDIWESRIADLEAENARLQARAEEFEAAFDIEVQVHKDRCAESDRYKALAERRVEALKANTPKCGEEDCGNVGVWMWWDSTDRWHMCDDHKSVPTKGILLLEGPELDDDAVLARAAIAATPDEGASD